MRTIRHIKYTTHTKFKSNSIYFSRNSINKIVEKKEVKFTCKTKKKKFSVLNMNCNCFRITKKTRFFYCRVRSNENSSMCGMKEHVDWKKKMILEKHRKSMDFFNSV